MLPWSPSKSGFGFLLFCLAILKSLAADESHLVTSLPGQPNVNFKQYAGYVTVDKSHGRALFYWFFESLSPDAEKRPLVLWLNGGPGCSSVGAGALSELGPLFPSEKDALYLNKHSWTKAANMIFLESPVGVGFSYTNTSSDFLHPSDEAIAVDSHAFLVGWFTKFPEYRQNDFYITGESYAGHYIPTLARVIVRQNKLPNGFQINFKGFAIGNPWSDPYSDNAGTTDFYYSHSLISDETYNLIKANCDFEKDLPIDRQTYNNVCRAAVQQADKDMQEIDVYDIYGPTCYQNTSSRSQRAFYSVVGHADPCFDPVTPYLNNPEVQTALHVNRQVTWGSCSFSIYLNYSKADFLQSMIPVYRQLLEEGLRIWIYSGDVDGIVSTIGTRKWINQLGLPVETPWYAWNYNNQVGGWTQQYTGLTFVTVRGAGHLVPATKPGPALMLFQNFLKGTLLPKF